MRTDRFDNAGAALLAMQALVRAKLKRGYSNPAGELFVDVKKPAG